MERRERGAGVAAMADQEPGARQQAARSSPGRRLGLLREATHNVHSALDAAVMRSGYFESAERFTDYLERLAAFHAGYARTLQDCDSAHWAVRWHIDQHERWIGEELSRLRRPAAQLIPPPVVPPLHLPDAATVLGSLYVIAGSTLGARMLQRLCLARAVPSPGGSTYLAALAQSLRWADFTAFLESADIASDTGLIDGALATFAGVRGALEAAP